MRSRHAELLNGMQEWEFPLRRGDALRAAKDMPVDRVRGSRWGRPLPAGALAELEEAIGELLPFGLLVLPQTMRPQGFGWRTRVCAPIQVVGLSGWGVALWVDVFGVRDWLPLADLCVIDHQQARGHGRLVLRGGGHCVSVRYPAQAGRAVRDFTAAVRGLATGHPRPVPAPRLDTPAALRRWRPVLDAKACADSEFAALERRLPGWWHRRRARRVLVGVTPYELLVALAPGGRHAGESVDLVYVPRSRLNYAASAGRTLQIDAGGVRVDVSLGRRQAARVHHRLGPALPGEAAGTGQAPHATPDQPPLGP